jgi:DNA invertase Pin-like site-specific DNA recombinase
MARQTFAYLHVSKVDQDLEKMKMDILKLANAQGLGHVAFVEEQVSDKVSWRKRQIAQVLENCHPGDSIIVSKLSGLGRSMLECLEILSRACEKEIHIYAVKGNWCLDGKVQSQTLANAFAIVMEIEHDMISTRTTEALRRRKEQGLTLGRPKGIGKSKLDQYRTEIETLLKNGSSKTWVAKRYQTTIANLSRWMQQRGIEGK